jgi:hypothetical protein
MTSRSRRKGDKTDAEGTTRLPHIQKALDAGLLKSPPEGDMSQRGRWGKTKKRRRKCGSRTRKKDK